MAKAEQIQATSEQVGRSTALMSALVIVSRITGFFRTWAQAFALGTTLLASCYTVANNLPNQIYELVIGGMLVTAFLPVYLSVKQKAGREGADAYISNLLSIVFVLMGALTLVCIVMAAQLVWLQSAATDQSEMVDAVFLFRFFAIEVLLYCLSSIAQGVLNAERDYLWSNAAPIINNLVVIASFFAFYALQDANPGLAMLLLALGNPLGVAVQVAVQLPSLKRHGVRISPRIDFSDPALKDTLAIGLPTLIVTFCSFVTVAVMNSMSLAAVPEQGSSIQYYARLWYTLPYSIFAVPISTALFTELSSLYAADEQDAFFTQVVSGTRQVLFTLIPFAMLLAVFSRPLMGLLESGRFDAESADLTAGYLAMLSVGLPFFGTTTFFQKTFSSMRRMGLFALSAVIGSVVQVAFTIALTPVIGIAAVALGSALCSAVSVFASLYLLERAHPGLDLRPVLASVGVALAVGALGSATCMGLWHGCTALLGPSAGILSTLVRLVVCGLPALVVCFGAALVLRRDEVSFIGSLISRFTRRARG